MLYPETAPPSLRSRLGRPFYSRPTATVARELIGHHLVRIADDGIVGGRIVETEAYLAAEDAASHSRMGPTLRNRSMFAAAGTLYVYKIHAKYCLNVSTESAGVGSAVLIRAIEPLWGLEKMALARGQTELIRLTRGPAMLCQALGITADDDGIDVVTGNKLTILRSRRRPAAVTAGPRIGISRSVDLMLRFRDPDSRFVSR